MSSLTWDTDAVMKLQFGKEGSIRRIPMRRLWTFEERTLSYKKLVDYVLDHVRETTKKFTRDSSLVFAPVSEFAVTITYVDEDGDQVTISSDDELTDAFRQVTSKLIPSLRARATVFWVSPSDGAVVDPLSEEYIIAQKTSEVATGEVSDNMEKLRQGQKRGKKHVVVALESLSGLLNSTVDRLVQTVEVIQQIPVSTRGRLSNTPNPEIQHGGKVSDEPVTITCSQSVPNSTVLHPTEGSNVFDPSYVHLNHTCDGCLIAPIVGYRYHAMELPDCDLCQNCMSKLKGSQIVFKPMQNGPSKNVSCPIVTNIDKPDNKTDAIKQNHEVNSTKVEQILNAAQVPVGFDPTFVHGRHTCDGCLTSPIIGIRYHTINAPDYDLCQNCIFKYKGKNITFEPAELDRDRPLQMRWKKREICRNRKNPCSRTVASSEGFDSALQEALRRSLQEANRRLATTGKETDSYDLSLQENCVELQGSRVETEQKPPVEDASVLEVNLQRDCDIETEREETVVEATVLNQQVHINPDIHVTAEVLRKKVSEPVEENGSQSKKEDTEGWEILCHEAQHDADVVQAAQLLGSTLFLSTMSSNSVESIPSVADSSPTMMRSFTSSVISDVSPVLLNRWESELRQLHELGFSNDRVNVDVLGTLEAANIGVDSSDPLRIEDVIDYLLKNA